MVNESEKRLTDQDKYRLIAFYKDNREMWSSDSTKSEKAAARIKLLEFFGHSYSLDLLEKHSTLFEQR